MNLNDVKGMMKDMGWHVPNLDDIDRSRSRFMTARDTCYPRQYPKQEGDFPRHYPKAESTPPKKKVEPSFQEREKSDAGKLADRFTELLKSKVYNLSEK